MTPARRASAFGAALALASATLGTTPQPPVDRCAPPSAAELAHAFRPSSTEPSVAELRRAVAHFAQVAERAERRRRWGERARALATVASLYDFLGVPDSALVAADAALKLVARADDGTVEPLVRAVYGETQQLRGRHDIARAHYDSGLAAVRAPALVALRGRLCTDLGAAHLELGELDSARHYLTRALSLRDRLGDREGVAVTLGNLGRTLQALGRADSALALFDSALALRRHTPNAVAEAALRNNVGYAYDLLGMADSALAAYDTAATVIRGRHPSYEGLTLMNRGRAQLALGRPADARRDLAAGRALKQAAGDSAGVAWALHDLGRVAIAEARWPDAEAALDSARRIMRAQGDRVREASALYFLAVAHHARGASHLRRAVAYYDSAAAVRLAVGRTATRDEDRVVFAEQDADLTARWALAWLALGDARAALLAAERGRARALRDLLLAARADTLPADGGPADDAETLGVAARTRAPIVSHLLADHALVTWLALPTGELRVHCARVARAAVDTLVAALRAQLWAAAPERGDDPPRERPTTLLGARDDALPASCERAPLDVARATAGGRDSLLGAAARLLLPAPIRAALPADTTELVLVPHGVLGMIPFAALPVDARGTPLGVRYALRHAPSLALLAAVERDDAAPARPTRALVVGDPQMPLDPDGGDAFPALRLAGETARWLADRFGTRALVGSAATTDAVLGAIGGADLVHFGTHGRAYGTAARAQRSFVALAPSAASDGLLTMADVMAGPRLSAGLVVLSACETGLGDVKAAEGTIGLQRAFLARGARGVLVTLWKVDTLATDALVRTFYRHWLDPRAARTKAEALRLAQAEVRRLSLARANPPHYWAGFQLVGAR